MWNYFLRNQFLRILFKSVRISATKFFQNQPSAKISSEKCFVFKAQYASQFGKALVAGKLPENIGVPLRLSGLKAFHALYVVILYDFLTIEREHEIIKNRWKVSAVCQR